MKFLKPSLSIISIIMFSTTMIIGASASNFADHKTGNSGALLDTHPISSSYILAFGNIMKEEQNKKNLKSDMDKYNDFIGNFYNENLIAKGVKKTRNKLEPGDIVQIKNNKTPFLLYLGKDADGNIHLENSYNELTYTKKFFDSVYAGKAIELTENSSNISSVQAKTVEKSLNISTPVQEQQNQYNWDNAYQDPRIIELAESITEDKETSWDKCQAIFCYVQTNYKWHDHDNTECSLNEVLNNKTGNCCELSRLEIAMVKSLDIDVETRYKHSNDYFYYSHVTHGHLAAQFKIDDNWVDADASTDGIIFGQENLIYREDLVVAYYDELPF
ncbi:transglutaminase family protein [Methanobacterium sp. SMA-27]|uniref:transglutaminase-like domain-containing protein n=1 Tax=Methanobacterium sp. SMA-27 TaxID=1495336 RepID=UPI00064F414F|nr:transglutaminase-like domain-containing protein [Methanobacterium sp. SMA-27]